VHEPTSRIGIFLFNINVRTTLALLPRLIPQMLRQSLGHDHQRASRDCLGCQRRILGLQRVEKRRGF